MKKLILKLLLVFLIYMPLACDKTDDGSFVEPITLYEKVYGTWDLANLKMVDEFAKANSIKPDEQNLSSLFNYDTFQLELNVDEKMEPTSYNVIGDVPPLFEPNGYWELSSKFQQTDAHPVIIYLYADAAKSEKTGELSVTSVPGSNKSMQIQLIRKSLGVPFISYVFNLNATNL